MNLPIDLPNIKQRVELADGSQIVLRDVLGRRDIEPLEKSQNVFRVGLDGKVIWRIATDFDAEGNPFTQLTYEDDSLSAYRWDGFSYVVDVETGVAKPNEFLK